MAGGDGSNTRAVTPPPSLALASAAGLWCRIVMGVVLSQWRRGRLGLRCVDPLGDDTVVDSEFPHAGLGAAAVTGHFKACAQQTIENLGNDITVAGQYEVIGRCSFLEDQFQKVPRACSFVEFGTDLDIQRMSSSHRLNGLRATGCGRRPDGPNSGVSEEVGDSQCLNAAPFVERALLVIEVPSAAIPRRGMANEKDTHLPKSLGRAQCNLACNILSQVAQH